MHRFVGAPEEAHDEVGQGEEGGGRFGATLSPSKCSHLDLGGSDENAAEGHEDEPP
jgi:hypothetical protein